MIANGYAAVTQKFRNNVRVSSAITTCYASEIPLSMNLRMRQA